MKNDQTDVQLSFNDILWNLLVGFAKVSKNTLQSSLTDVYQTASYITKRFQNTYGSYFVPSDRTSMFGLLISNDQAEVVKCDFTFKLNRDYQPFPIVSSTAFCSNPAQYDLNIGFWKETMLKFCQTPALQVNENVFKYHRDSNYFKGYPLCWKQVFDFVEFVR